MNEKQLSVEGGVYMDNQIDKQDLIEKSIKVFGLSSQFRQFHEEMGELLVAVSHYDRGRCTLEDVAIEMADVLQMIDALRAVYGIPDDYFENIQKRQWLKLKSQIEARENAPRNDGSL